MKALPKVGIIVLNYNGNDCLFSCLQSLDRLEYPEKDIIIVDNGSSDDSLANAERSFPYFTFVRNEKNKGFAEGMNAGMRLALRRGAQWCWLFNYDAVADPQSLSVLLLAAQENPRAGLLSPMIYGSDGGIWFGKGEIDFFRMRARHTSPSPEERMLKTYPSQFLTGCALLIKKELIDTIGSLDEDFFLYYEDADYCLRASRAGFSCLVVPGARVIHGEVSRSRPEKIYFLVSSGLLFFEKWAPLLARPYLTAYVTMRRIKNFLDRILRNSLSAQEAHRAYRDHYGN